MIWVPEHLDDTKRFLFPLGACGNGSIVALEHLVFILKESLFLFCGQN
jgi:hypothetical protein